MELEKIRDLSKARLEHADECISAAKSLLKNGNFKSASNRAYIAEKS